MVTTTVPSDAQISSLSFVMKETAPDFLLLGGDAVCREPRLYQLKVDLAGLAGPQ